MSEPAVVRLDSAVGVEVAGVDLSQRLSDTAFNQILAAFNRHSVLVIRNQQLDAHLLASFARRVGTLQISANQRYCCPDEPEIMMVGNLRVNGEFKSMFTNGSEDWHIDQIQTKRPNVATCLYAVETPPEGGDTLFAGMHTAYNALDDETKKTIADLVAVYSIANLDAVLRAQDPSRPPLSRQTLADNPPASHPLVRRHPVTGRKSLCIAPDIMSHIEGMTREASLDLVRPLAEHAIRLEHIYRHQWRNGDLVMWDNRCLLHTATVFDAERYQRLLYRAIISDE